MKHKAIYSNLASPIIGNKCTYMNVVLLIESWYEAHSHGLLLLYGYYINPMKWGHVDKQNISKKAASALNW